MESCKVSIIVPVYNCEPYIEKCVNSILAQTEPDFQLILVDDGSKDGSGRICDDYAAIDKRVLVIHQENAGVSAARNAGLEAATGEYIGFVDADDFILPNMLEVLLRHIDAANICMFDLITIWDSGKNEPDTIDLLGKSQTLRKSDFSPHLLRMMAGSACRCLYRAELLSDIRFPAGLKLSEDRLFNLQAMGKADSVCYLKEGLYYRYMRQGSACNSYHPDLFEQYLKWWELAEPLISQYWGEAYKPVYVRMCVIQGALGAIYQICGSEFPGADIKSRISAIRRVADHESIKTAFMLCPPEGLRENFLAKGFVWPLFLIGIANDVKNGDF